MKKVYFYTFASALLLASAAGFSSCSTDSAESTSSEPTGARDVVKTQFAINIPYAGDNGSSTSNAKTRMTDTNTQNNKTGQSSQYNNFRGIENMILLAFDGEPGSTNHGTATKLINIGSGNNAYSKGVYTSLYRDIEIPVGTTHFIMNGRAMRTAQGATTESSNFEIGKITAPDNYSNITELNQLKFKLTPIQEKADFSTNTDAQAILKLLNDLAKTSVTYKDNENDADSKTLAWSELSGKKESDLPSWMSDQERAFLAERYTRFTSLTAGSKASVQATIENLKEVLVGESASTEGATTVPSNKQLTAKIYENCQSALTDLGKITNQFPRNLDLPDGVAKLSFAKGSFSYESAQEVTIGTGNKINYNKICYPAEISYFVKTKAMVSAKEISGVNQLPDYDKWLASPSNTDIWGNGFAEGAVTTATKSVALQDPIQYSVACLKTSVVCNDTDGKLEDNKKGILDPNDNNKDIQNASITIPDGGFKIRAILVGGQPASVNWDFYPTDQTFDCTIYDKDMNGNSDNAGKFIAATTSSSGTYNYTLVMDNKKTVTSDEKQSKVYVTIELENGSTSFYGKDGLVPANGRFYLVGELDPSDTKSATQPTEDETKKIDRVFVQDHTTVANFKITSLKNAYNCIPDLRTAGVNVGLAVDLDWQEGITFEKEL